VGANLTKTIFSAVLVLLAIPIQSQGTVDSWREVQTLRLRTGVIKVGMRIQDFNKATGRDPIGRVYSCSFNNYTYATQLEEGYRPYANSRCLVIGSTDFQVIFQSASGGNILNREVVRKIRLFQGPPHPSPTGQLNTRY
jgi:hypothetical protein